jgi:hypothetical protein
MGGRATLKGRTILLAGAVVGLAAGVAALHTDQLVNRGLGNALGSSRPGFTFEAVTAKAKAPATTGDEAFWLTGPEGEGAVPIGKALAKGDHITIANREGHKRQLEIVDVKFPEVGPGQSARMVVICRVPGAGANVAGSLMRLTIELEPPPAAVEPVSAPPQPKAL